MKENNFSSRLSMFRQNKNMTQEELAERMGVTPQALSKWERGHSLPDIRNQHRRFIGDRKSENNRKRK